MPGGKAGPLLLSVVRRACALASLPSTGFSAAISPCSALTSSSFASMPLAALSAASLSAATGGLPSEAAAAPPLDVAGRAGRFLGGRPAYSSRVATMLLHSRGRVGGNAEVGWECREARREQARHRIPRNRPKASSMHTSNGTGKPPGSRCVHQTQGITDACYPWPCTRRHPPRPVSHLHLQRGTVHARQGLQVLTGVLVPARARRGTVTGAVGHKESSGTAWGTETTGWPGW